MRINNPVPTLEGLLAVFEDGAAKGGTFVDQVMCQTAIDGIADAILAIGMLGSRMEASGLLEPFTEEPAAPRTPVERRQLARFAAPFDPDGRVVQIPTAFTREAGR
ncbi:hypothetical protein [Methylobacterium aquaticum]|jgi:hypothetical protein|uniref:Uncharacterized protein n=1 Tax=Methylobacterium aquaticum TaxID=270351 RepID=A0A0J6S5A1_9HYPH|nr:hypothetical protein [Methylobacterium aquaticum]KMO28633.1 hypothetical protein VP06_26920 [Methylobacterium aquaticum]